MSEVLITDYVSNPEIEKSILGDSLISQSLYDCEEVKVLLVWHHQVTDGYLQKFPNLKGVVRYGVGFDNIDLGAIKKRNLFFCNTPDYGIDEVSDTAIAMAMSLVRGIHYYNFKSQVILDGSWQENTYKAIKRTSSLTFGCVGAGRIGTSVLLKASALGFQTTFYDPYVSSGYEKAIKTCRSENLQEFLAISDVVSLHLPLSEESRGLVNKEFLSLMKPGSILVNTARGELIHDLDDIFDEILNGQLNGVALDVLPTEPPKSGKLIDAWRSNLDLASKILINPHTAYYSQESFVEMRKKAAANAKLIIDGFTPRNIIAEPKAHS